MKGLQKSHLNICTDNDSNKNIKEPAQTVTFVTDLDDVKYFFLHVESSLFSGAAQGNACDSIIRRWKRKVKKCSDRIRQLS